MLRFFALILPFALMSCSEEQTNVGEKKTSQNNLSEGEIEQSYEYGDTIKTKAIETANNLPDGPVVINYPNGVVKAKGEIKKGEKVGLWESYYPDGTNYSATYFVNGIQNGHSTTYHKNGTVKYKGEYKDGKPSGSWTFYDVKGNIVKEKGY